ncbi:MAG: hypothetical protein ACJ8H8_24300 [Geminicoccaceae bacterium]
MAAFTLIAVWAEHASAAAADGQVDPAGSPAAVAAIADRAGTVQDVRTLPVLKPWQPGDPTPVRPTRVMRPAPGAAAALGAEPPQSADRAALQPSALTRRFVVEGTPFTGPSPPDPTGAVGPNHFVQAVNASSSSAIAIYDKSGKKVAGPFRLGSLYPSASHPCRTDGLGDPVVVFDYQASRWLLMELISSGNALCLYVSNNSNPVSGGFKAFTFTPPEFPDYPKLGVAPTQNAYLITVSDSRSRVFALKRSSLLAGAASVPMVTFKFPLLSGFTFQALTPATVASASSPPSGTPAYAARHRDTEVHGGTAPAGRDLIELFELKPNFSSPSASTSLRRSITVPDFNSRLCGLETFDCVPQPGTTQRLDGIREVIMQPLQYRRNGSTESLVGGFSVDGNGADLAAPYWFELRRSLTGWIYRQGQRYMPTTTLNRWLPSLGIDRQGNIAMGFSTSSGSGSNYPSALITGRLAGDPLSTLRTATTVKAGTGSQTANNRWGDYAATTVDPSDNCTFWFTSEYIPAGGRWRTTIGAFKFPGC